MSKFLVLLVSVHIILGSLQLLFAKHHDRNEKNFDPLHKSNIDDDIRQRAKTDGYRLKSYTVQTEDSYILTLHRIRPKTAKTAKKPVVFLVHGIMMSSMHWIIMGKEKALAYLLADSGYDVWMMNHRGNIYSQEHSHLNTKSSEYWNFSWHEMGVYDLPRSIDFILEKTEQTMLDYIGYSQGSTTYFILMSLRPEYNDKVRTMHALAPVAFMGNMNNGWLRFLGPLFANFRDREFSAPMIDKNSAALALCRARKPSKTSLTICANIIFNAAGRTQNLNLTMIPDIFNNTPAGGSIKQMVHYAQSFVSHQFRQFDYGRMENIIRYKNEQPPNYPLEKITSGIFFYYSNNDVISAPNDVQKLASKIQNLCYNKAIKDHTFSHMDFMLGMNVKEMVYDKVMKNLKKKSF